MTSNFKHINASEQIQDSTVTASLLATNAAVLSLHADSNPNLTGAVQVVSGTHITLSQVGQVITVNATGELSQTLTNSHIFVGNASNIATDVSMSGDATIANTGALTLANTAVTPGSYTNTNLTVDSKGRITAASNGVSTTPGGSDGDVQFNSGGSFAGSSNFTWDNTATTLSLIGTVPILSLRSNTEAAVAFQSADGLTTYGTLLALGATGMALSHSSLIDVNVSAIHLSVSATQAFVTDGPDTPDDPSAIFEITSTTKGFLPPRMTSTQRTAISSPAEGLQVYDTTVHQLYLWNGSSWAILG